MQHWAQSYKCIGPATKLSMKMHKIKSQISNIKSKNSTGGLIS